MSVRVLRSGRVICEAAVLLPMSAISAWGQLRDFQTSAAHDPFHSGFQIEGGVPRQGVSIRIEHRYLLFRTVRCGRILQWNEGRGFSFSDLSMMNKQKGFPHVFAVQLQPVDLNKCQLIIRVTGRWTAPLPRFVAWLWLSWVFMHVVVKTRNQLLRFAVARARLRSDAG